MSDPDPDVSRDLAGRLRRVSAEIERDEPHFAVAINDFVVRLAGADAGAGAPAMGEIFPNFVLPNLSGKLVALSDLLDAGPVVVSFLRGHWCPYCRAQADAFTDFGPELEAAGASVVLVTPERSAFARKLIEPSTSRLALCDIGHGVATSLGLTVAVDEPLARLLAEEGSDLPRFQGVDGWFVPLAATFVLDKSGVVVARFVEPDYRVRMGMDELLAAIAAAR